MTFLSLKVKEVSQPPEISGGYIFNTPEFQSLKEGGLKYFALYEQEKPIARICFRIDNNKAISGHQATFGSIDAEHPLPEEKAKYFLDYVCKTLKNEGVKEVIIKHWPECYADSHSLHEVFINSGFEVINNEVNQHLQVRETEFSQLIRKNEKKKLNQCIKQGYPFKKLSIDELDDIYQLVTETRVRKGFPVSMDFAGLYQTVKSMPDKYLLFGLFDQHDLIAASVSIRISKNILYNFYHADEFSYRSTSPLVMLVQEIYKYCQQNGIKILDLGISSDQGQKNEGLFIFKENLGCVTSNKNTYFLRYD